MIIDKSTTTKYWIAYNENKSVIHYGITNPNEETVSGQPLYEIFDTELEYKNRLTELNIE